MSLLSKTHPPANTNATMTTSTSTSSIAPNVSALPHPSTVGNSFVKQYYHLLAQSPETLHRFYKDDSKFTHGLGSQEEHSISGQKNINDKIMSMGYAGAHVDLESGSVDCQSSLDGGVLVMVAGIMTLRAQSPQAFVQTFFLAVQPNGYFVLNDAFRYLDTLESTMIVHKTLVSSSPPLPPLNASTIATVSVSPLKSTSINSSSPTLHSSVQDSIPTPVVAAVVPNHDHVKSPVAASPVVVPASPVKKGWGDIPSSPVVPSAAKATSADHHSSSTTLKPTYDEEKEKPTLASPVTTTKTTTSSAPKSWASHLFMGAKPVTETTGAGKKTASSPKSKKSSKSTSASSGWGELMTEGSKNSTLSSEAEAELVTTAAPKSSEKPRAAVLYIRDLPSHAKESDVLQLFSPFGTITATTVAAAKGFAFVDYEHFSSVEMALKGCPFKLLDCPIHVEERPPDRRDGGKYNRDGRTSRGRGNNNHRQHFNGRGNNHPNNGRSSINSHTPNTNMKSSTRSRNGSGKQSARAD